MPAPSKYERAFQQIEQARHGRGLVERRCPECDAVMGEYAPPIKLYRQKCRHCGLYSDLSVMPERNGAP